MANRLAEYEQSHAVSWRPAGVAREPGWQDRLNEVQSLATQWVREHPGIALAAAVATGVVLGWFIKRR
jgi:hypothetical protein